jgi:hypothetical protein
LKGEAGSSTAAGIGLAPGMRAGTPALQYTLSLLASVELGEWRGASLHGHEGLFTGGYRNA